MKTQNKAIAKDAAITGLPTLDKNDDPTPAQRKKWQDDYAKAQGGALKLAEAFTTVWTNHGEPQEIDEKYSPDVALETEADTDATRQAEPQGADWQKVAIQIKANFDRVTEQRDELAKIGQGWMDAYNEAATQRDELQKEVEAIKTDRAWYNRTLRASRAQRDELLAVLKPLAKLARQMIHDQAFDVIADYYDTPEAELAAAEAAIANAEK